MVWYGMVWYGMVWYGTVWYGMVWYGMVWYGMVWPLRHLRLKTVNRGTTYILDMAGTLFVFYLIVHVTMLFSALSSLTLQ